LKPSKPEALQVEGTECSFAWYISGMRGRDGKFGATKPELIDASAGGRGASVWTRRPRFQRHDVVSGRLLRRGKCEKKWKLILRDSGCDPQRFCSVDALQARRGAAVRSTCTLILLLRSYESACAGRTVWTGSYKMHGM